MKITKRSDGRYTAAVNLGKGKRKYVYGATAEEVKQKAYAAGNAHHTGAVVPTAKGSVGAFLDRWLTFVRDEGRRRSRTVDGWENYCRIYIKPGLGHIQLAKLNAADVSEFLATMKPQTRPGGGKGRGAKGRTVKALSPTTKRNALRVLRVALKQAVRWELVAKNVAAAEYVDAPRGGKKEARFLSEEEAQALVAAIEDDRQRCEASGRASMGALFLTMIATGLRPSEAYGLTWERVDLEAGILRVRESLEFDKEEKRHWLGELKTDDSRRDLALPAPVIDALRLHQTAQKRLRLLHAKEWKEAPIPNLVFTTRAGRPLDPAHVRRKLRELLDKAGAGHATPYALRHSWATLALAQGVQMRVVMEQLGHSQIATTANVYSHVVERLQRDASDKVGAALFRRKNDAEGT